MINIQDIIPFMKDGWVAMDKNGSWWWYPVEPYMNRSEWWFTDYGEYLEGKMVSSMFDIAPADDWTKSLIKVGGK